LDFPELGTDWFRSWHWLHLRLRQSPLGDLSVLWTTLNLEHAALPPAPWAGVMCSKKDAVQLVRALVCERHAQRTGGSIQAGGWR